MINLKMHTEGNYDHLNAIRQKYAKLKEALRKNSRMNSEEMQVELEKLNKCLK